MPKFHQTLCNAFSDSREVNDYTTKGCNDFITVQHEKVTFKMQSGNVKDFGLNGVQSEEVLMYIKSHLELLNSHVPSEHNTSAISHINKAIDHLHQRTSDRKSRGVESTNEQ